MTEKDDDWIVDGLIYPNTDSAELTMGYCGKCGKDTEHSEDECCMACGSITVLLPHYAKDAKHGRIGE